LHVDQLHFFSVIAMVYKARMAMTVEDGWMIVKDSGAVNIVLPEG